MKKLINSFECETPDDESIFYCQEEPPDEYKCKSWCALSNECPRSNKKEEKK